MQNTVNTIALFKWRAVAFFSSGFFGAFIGVVAAAKEPISMKVWIIALGSGLFTGFSNLLAFLNKKAGEIQTPK